MTNKRAVFSVLITIFLLFTPAVQAREKSLLKEIYAREACTILQGSDGEEIRGKKVLVIDDVISTGESLAAVEKLLAKFDVDIVGKAAVLAEGDAADRDDIIFLEKLPLFFK